MTIPAGWRVGRYEIESLLGAGGMGEVYLARDPALGRPVAIKTLRPGVVGGADRLQRLVREARAASGLNHPYILTVHEVGTAVPEPGHPAGVPSHDEVHYIVTEFVEGVTFRAKLEADRLDLGKVLGYLIQVAEGLAKAHAAGIVHRDLKPDNIMVTPEGFVKILDFGLAKLVEGGEDGLRARSGDASTVMHPQSSPGMIVGTAAYMSPEQARGRPLDTRSDIFSFGCILYEAAAGRQPFAGASTIETLHNIIHAPVVPLRDAAPGTPGELDRIVCKCLAKEADERYQTIKDVALDLKALRREPDVVDRRVAGAVTPAQRPVSSAEYVVESIKRHKRGAAVLGVLGALALVVAAAWGLNAPGSRERGAAASPQMRVSRLTSTGAVRHAAISPDGNWAVHVVEEAGQQGLWIRQIATGSNVNVLAPADTTYLGLTFSRDGNYVYYVKHDGAGTAGTLYRMPALGGASRKILDGVHGTIALSPDGTRLAFVRYDFSAGESSLVVADADGGQERVLALRRAPEGFEPDTPAWSPDGTLITSSGYSNDGLRLVTIAVADGTERRVWDLGVGSLRHTAWLPDASGILALAADQSSGFFYQIWHVGYPGGEARRVTNDLSSYVGVSLTADAGTLLTVQGDMISNVWVAPGGDARRAHRITSGRYDGAMGVAWTPDARIVQASRDWNISILDADGRNQKLLTPDEHNNRWVSVTRDGQYILFESWRKNSTSAIWRMDIDGGNPRQLTRSGAVSAPSGAYDSRSFVYESDVSGVMTIWKASIDGGQETPLIDRNTEEPAVSPDGRLVACFHYPGRGVKLLVVPFEGGEPVAEFDVDPSVLDKRPAWSPDGHAITYVVHRGGTSNIWSQPLAGGDPVQVTDFPADRIFAFDWAPDGSLALSRGVTSHDVVLITGFK
jgi:eukaryotic-like serine/threonine-protein kinase